MIIKNLIIEEGSGILLPSCCAIWKGYAPAPLISSCLCGGGGQGHTIKILRFSSRSLMFNEVWLMHSVAEMASIDWCFNNPFLSLLCLLILSIQSWTTNGYRLKDS